MDHDLMGMTTVTGTQFDDRGASGQADAATFPHASAEGRDRSIPIRTGDLARLLLAEPGLSPADREGLARLVRLLGAVFHYEFYAWLTELKELYAPIDPDSDCVPVPGFSRPATDADDETFLGAFEAALVKANYRKLEFKVLEQAIAAPNELGLNYVPDLKLFEHLRVYVRGRGRIDRTIRTIKTRFLKRTLTHDAYRRVVILLKFKPSTGLGDYVRSDVVYLRMFRDVPHAEMDMHLPEQGTKIRMPWIDRIQVASPLMIGLPTLAAKAIFTSMLVSPWALPILLSGPIGAGVKSFFGFQRTKQKYLAKMIRHLYYLTLANNSSVINRLVDSAEEEEFKEALLGYYFLWAGRDDPEPWDSRRLDARIEAYLRKQSCGDVDFEIGDALAKLHRLGLIRRDPQDHLEAVPIDVALGILDGQWDDYFRYNPRGDR